MLPRDFPNWQVVYKYFRHWSVKSRKIIDTFFGQLGLFLGPVFHRLKGRTVAQRFLRDVLIVDLERSV